MENLAIRNEAKEQNVRLWMVAEAIGISDSAFSRMLRRELPSEKQACIIGLIHKIAEGGEAVTS